MSLDCTSFPGCVFLFHAHQLSHTHNSYILPYRLKPKKNPNKFFSKFTDNLFLLQLIFSREYTQAEDRNWHRKHFCCYECDRDLGGLLYVARDGHPHCMECYNRLYAKKCSECRYVIEADAKRIEYEGEFWHARDNCFKCAMCKTSLIGRQFLRHPKKNKIFCSTECARRY